MVIFWTDMRVKWKVTGRPWKQPWLMFHLFGDLVPPGCTGWGATTGSLWLLPPSCCATWCWATEAWASLWEAWSVDGTKRWAVPLSLCAKTKENPFSSTSCEAEPRNRNVLAALEDCEVVFWGRMFNVDVLCSCCFIYIQTAFIIVETLQSLVNMWSSSSSTGPRLVLDLRHRTGWLFFAGLHP